MVKTPVVLTDDVTVQAAGEMLIQHGVSEAYVIDDAGQLLGRIDAVVVLKVNNEDSFNKLVSFFLSKPKVVLQEQMSLLDATTTLQSSADNSIPVIDDETSRQFVGIIDKNVLMQAVLSATTDT